MIELFTGPIGLILAVQVLEAIVALATGLPILWYVSRRRDVRAWRAGEAR